MIGAAVAFERRASPAGGKGKTMTIADTTRYDNFARSAGAHKPRGRPKSAEAGNRVHISIPESLTVRLQEIQRATHATSITEVVKAALTLYAAAIDEHKNGGHVYLKRKDDGVERQLALFI
jgi:hypothetical protein